MTEHSDLWAVAGAATLMVMLRCGPILLPSEPITRDSRALTIASHVAIGFALLSALYRLFSLDAASIVAGLVFAGSGFVIFVTFRSLPTALIGATVIYAGVRLVLQMAEKWSDIRDGLILGLTFLPVTILAAKVGLQSGLEPLAVLVTSAFVASAAVSLPARAKQGSWHGR